MSKGLLKIIPTCHFLELQIGNLTKILKNFLYSPYNIPKSNCYPYETSNHVFFKEIIGYVVKYWLPVYTEHYRDAPKQLIYRVIGHNSRPKSVATKYENPRADEREY
ncbi:hypothetical protein ACTXT7_001344 [Hymenolepis weldensis]